MSADLAEVHCAVINQVALIKLDRPHALNALSHAMVLRMHAILDAVERDQGVRALVMRGAGANAFCAGVVQVHSVDKDRTPVWTIPSIDELMDERLAAALATVQDLPTQHVAH